MSDTEKLQYLMEKGGHAAWFGSCWNIKLVTAHYIELYLALKEHCPADGPSCANQNHIIFLLKVVMKLKV